MTAAKGLVAPKENADKTASELAVENAALGMSNEEIVAALKAAPKRGEIPADVRVALDQRKNRHLVAAKMSEMNWGKGLDEMTRRAVAAYLERNQLDLTEVDVLGGNLYRNSRYYKRRLAEMVEDGKIEYVKSDWVHADARLKTLASLGGEQGTWATDEQARRERVRIEYGIPDAAVGACVFRVKVHGVDKEMTAAKWCGGGTRVQDPVGDKFPMESSESRSCRRAMTLVASSIPALRWREEDLNDQGIEFGAVLKEGLARSDAQEVFQPKALAAPAEDGGYGIPAEPEPVVRKAPVSPAGVPISPRDG